MKHFIAFTFVLLTSLTVKSQIGWVGNMFPLTGSVGANDPFNVYIQVWKDGVTNGPGQGGGIICQIWYGQVPSFGSGWTNQPPIVMNYNVDIGNNDEYVGIMTLPQGFYEYTCRCSDNNGSTWTWRTGPNGQLTVTAPLAVSWGEIKGRRMDDRVILDWNTLLEDKHAHFEIEASTNGQEFVVVGIKPSDVRNNRGARYNLTLSGKDATSTYYRIKAVDLDGKESYSEMIFVPNSTSVQSSTLSIYPNPVQDVLTINGPRNEILVTIFDSFGNQVLSQTINGQEINISSLTAGNYWLMVDGQKIRFTKI